jgi:urea transport system permease protein
MSLFLTDSFSVISLASIFVLISLGLYFTFGLLGLVNMLHGELMLLGAYFAFAVQEATGSPVVGFIFAPLVVAVIGLVLERTIIRFFYDRILESLLATFGLSLIIRQAIQLFYSTVPRQVNDPLQGPFTVLGVGLPRWRLLIVAVDVLLIIGIRVLLSRSRFGVRARAAVQDPDFAGTIGINVGAVRAGLFAIGAGLAGLAGALMAPLSTLNPFFGLLFLVNAILVVILGGVGSFWGLVVAGLVLGGVLGILQFSVSTVLAQMLMLVVAAVGVRYRPLLVELWVRRRASHQLEY